MEVKIEEVGALTRKVIVTLPESLVQPRLNEE